MAAPGVVVSTAVRPGPTGIPRAVSGQYFVAGLAERGPIDAPQKVNSLGDYRRIFGDRVSYGALYDDLAAYFEAGGTQAWVLRIVGAAATVGTVTLPDTADADTVRVDAASPGAFSSRLAVRVEAGTNGAGTRRVSVLLDGVVVEQYNNIASVAELVAKFATSIYVRFSPLGSVTVAPGDLPAVTATDQPLTAGTDDRAAINAARVEARLPLLKIGLGDGAVAAPGFGSTVHAALIAHAKEHRRIALLSAARGATAGDLAALGQGLGGVSGAEYAGLFAPYLQVSDGAGGTRVISPEGFVAASRSKAHELIGPWAPAAGEGSISASVVGLDQEFTRAEAELLSTSRVSPVRTIQNRIRLYDWRSLSGNEADYGSLTVRDTLNRLVNECEARLEPFVFRNIDGRGQLFAEMTGVLIGVLEPVRAARGLFERVDPFTGDTLDPGYSVDVTRNVNTTETLANNEVRAVVAVRLAPNASLINLTIVKVGLAAAV